MTTKKGQAQQIAEYSYRHWHRVLGVGTWEKRARVYFNAVLDEIAGELHRTGHVFLPGFGTFEVRTRKARSIRTPQGQPLLLPETKEIRFFPARAMVERVTGRRPS